MPRRVHRGGAGGAAGSGAAGRARVDASSTPSSETLRPGRHARPRLDARRRPHPSAAGRAALPEPAGPRRTSAKRRWRRSRKDRSVMDRVRANREVHDLLRDGYRAEWRDDDGERAVTRRSATSTSATRRRTTGWPRRRCGSPATCTAAARTRCCSSTASRWCWLEFKEPNRPVKAAYDENLTDYRDTIPQLFVPNGFVICCRTAPRRRSASTYAPWEFFGDWKVIDADGTRGVVALETAIRGTCAPRPAARPGRELRRLHRAARRPGQESSPATTRCSASTPRSRTCYRIRADGRQAPRGVLAHPGVGQVACRCCGSPRRCCAASRARGRS